MAFIWIWMDITASTTFSQLTSVITALFSPFLSHAQCEHYLFIIELNHSILIRSFRFDFFTSVIGLRFFHVLFKFACSFFYVCVILFFIPTSSLSLSFCVCMLFSLLLFQTKTHPNWQWNQSSVTTTHVSNVCMLNKFMLGLVEYFNITKYDQLFS